MRWYVGPAIAALVLYGLGSFSAWNMNPAEWESFGRFVLFFMWIVVSVIMLNKWHESREVARVRKNHDDVLGMYERAFKRQQELERKIWEHERVCKGTESLPFREKAKRGLFCPPSSRHSEL